jgi:hypothetical protein
MARLLPLPETSSRFAARASGGIPKRCAERNAAPGSPISVQLSAALRTRPGRLATIAVLLGGVAPFFREPSAAGAEPSQPATSPAATSSVPPAAGTRVSPRATFASDSGRTKPRTSSPDVGPSAARVRGHTPATWPAGPALLPGSVLPAHRIVAFYGNPYSKRMGILGELAPDSMFALLRKTAGEWAAADSSEPVLPALHLIATVAQGQPGRDGMHRLRMPDSLIAQVAGWAEANHWLLFLDVQVGRSTVQRELPRLVPYLARPYVHLALDPEFSMKDGSAPGTRIGTLDAADVNYAVRVLEGLVDSLGLPPKVLVVHRFTQRMLTNYGGITVDPRVQVVIDMDGFGGRPLKRSVYRDFVVKEPVQFTGFKLFYKNDQPMMTPDEVLSLSPVPLYIQYQ